MSVDFINVLTVYKCPEVIVHRNTFIIDDFSYKTHIYIYKRRPCSDFMDMLRRLISRRIIIITCYVYTRMRSEACHRFSQAKYMIS